MSDLTDLVTVFRSADPSAEEDAKAIGELLSTSGLHPVVLDDSAPGVPDGAWEVQVPSTESVPAEGLIAAHASLPAEPGDSSTALDTETVFTGSEFEVNAVRGALEQAGIETVVVGDAVLPNLEFELRVAKADVERAQAVLAAAEEAGAAAADEEAAESGSAPA